MFKFSESETVAFYLKTLLRIIASKLRSLPNKLFTGNHHSKTINVLPLQYSFYSLVCWWGKRSAAEAHNHHVVVQKWYNRLPVKTPSVRSSVDWSKTNYAWQFSILSGVSVLYSGGILGIAYFKATLFSISVDSCRFFVVHLYPAASCRMLHNLEGCKILNCGNINIHYCIQKLTSNIVLCFLNAILLCEWQKK